MSKRMQAIKERLIYTGQIVHEGRYLAVAEGLVNHRVHACQIWATGSLKCEPLRFSDGLLTRPSEEPYAPSCVLDEAPQGDEEMKIVNSSLTLQSLAEIFARIQIAESNHLPILIDVQLRNVTHPVPLLGSISAI